MTITNASLVFAVFTSALFAQPTTSPAPGDTGQPSANQDNRDTRRARERERREQFRNATPAERSQMRVDRIVEMTARTYELDDMQKVMVRQEILRMQAERRAEMGADAEEYDRLRERMFEFRSQPREDNQGGDRDRDDRRAWRREMRDNPDFRQLRDKMRQLEEKYPMDWEAAAQRVEALLPPEQAERGRQRREEEWGRRRDRDRDRDGDRRGPGRNRGGSGGTSGSSQNPTTERPVVQPAPTPIDVDPKPVAPADSPQSAQGQHPWEVYTRQFIAQHELTETQATSAQAILRDLRSQASQFEKSVADRVAEAEKIRDSVSRQKRLAELRAPQEELFGVLKTRLNSLLTTAQRQRAGL